MAKSLLKNYFMAIVAIVMIVGFSAFKVVENNSAIKMESWYYNGGNDGEGNASNYDEVLSSQFECGEIETICLIEAPEDPFNLGHPDLDYEVDPINNPNKTVQDYINEALDTGQDNEVVKSFRKL